MLLLAEMPAVIAPEHDDRVVALRALFERIEHATEHRIGEVNRREIGLDALLPLLVLLNVRKVAIPRESLACGRQIIDIIRFVTGRKLDAFERKRLEILLRHKPRLMRPVDATGEEERLVLRTLELLANPLRHRPIAAKLLIRDIQRGPVSLDVLPVTATRQVHRPFLG
jgi:hypothetical protein